MKRLYKISFDERGQPREPAVFSAAVEYLSANGIAHPEEKLRAQFRAWAVIEDAGNNWRCVGVCGFQYVPDLFVHCDDGRSLALLMERANTVLDEVGARYVMVYVEPRAHSKWRAILDRLKARCGFRWLVEIGKGVT